MFTATSTTLRRMAHLAATVPLVVAAACRTENPPIVREAEASTVTPTEKPLLDPPLVVQGMVVDATPADGESLYKAGKFKEAASTYKVRVADHPTDGHGFYMLGLARWKSGDFVGAKDAFDKSIEIAPEFAKAYFNGARNLLDAKRPSEALELVLGGLKVDSTSPDGWRLKARAQSEMGEVTAAFATYRDRLIIDDTDAWTLNNFGVFLMQHGCLQEAVGPLARAVQLQPNAPVFQNNLGMALEKAGYPVTALTHYGIAVSKDSTFSRAVRNYTRTKERVSDSTKTEEISVVELAESFRGKVRSWKTEKTEPTPTETKPPVDPR